MGHRSRFLAACSAAACIVAIAAPQAALANGNVVAFAGYATGTIVVKTNERRLYLVVDGQHAISYPVGVGKAGKPLAPAAQRALAEAAARRAERERAKPQSPEEIAGRGGLDPTRYGDWEVKGVVSDF